MENLNELQCLERLTELAEMIEKNNWEHLYKDVPIANKIHEQKEEIKKLTDTVQQMKLKSMAIADLNTALKALADAANS